jgi:hypothetical protein
MPEENMIERARRDAKQGKSPSTPAGEFVREEIHHVRGDLHDDRPVKQATAIGLSKARGIEANFHHPKTEKRQMQSGGKRRGIWRKDVRGGRARGIAPEQRWQHCGGKPRCGEGGKSKRLEKPRPGRLGRFFFVSPLYLELLIGSSVVSLSRPRGSLAPESQN